MRYIMFPESFGRYFNPVDVDSLWGCTCTTCSDIIAGSSIRNTARKQDSEKCKCPKGSVVNGKHEWCKLEPSRYFDPRVLWGKDCQCLDDVQVKALAQTTQVKALEQTTFSTTTTETYVKTIF